MQFHFVAGMAGSTKEFQTRTQVCRGARDEGALMDLVLTSKEGNVQLQGSLGCRDHEVVESNFLRAGRRV